jgi:hypothetical protein
MARHSALNNRLIAFPEETVWPQIPAEQHGLRWTKAEEAMILGYDEDHEANQSDLN